MSISPQYVTEPGEDALAERRVATSGCTSPDTPHTTKAATCR